jgi:hypothetical protein
VRRRNPSARAKEWSAAQFDIAPGVIETKNRICAEARNGQIDES